MQGFVHRGGPPTETDRVTFGNSQVSYIEFSNSFMLIVYDTMPTVYQNYQNKDKI